MPPRVLSKIIPTLSLAHTPASAVVTPFKYVALVRNICQGGDKKTSERYATTCPDERAVCQGTGVEARMAVATGKLFFPRSRQMRGRGNGTVGKGKMVDG